MFVVSNNPRVLEHVQSSAIRVEGTSLDVLYKALDMLAEGKYNLFAPPIAGNARLLHNPFRTMVFQDRSTADMLWIHQQIAHVIRAIDKMEDINYNNVLKDTFKDYATVDYELYLATIRGHIENA